jgi:hypothetical protein
MKIEAYITIEDDTSEEELTARGVSVDSVKAIYDQGFENILESIRTPEVRTTLHTTVSDNTKEAKI